MIAPAAGVSISRDGHTAIVQAGAAKSSNGMVKAGNGISEAGYTWPSLVIGPRVGAAHLGDAEAPEVGVGADESRADGGERLEGSALLVEPAHPVGLDP